MEVVNPFILKNKERMVVFLDHLSVSNTYHPPLSLFLIPDIIVRLPKLHNFILLLQFQSVREKPYPDEERVKGDPARDLAIIHHLCETHLQELQGYTKSQVIIDF